MEFQKNFQKKNLIFLAAAVCTFILAGCSAKESTITENKALTETVQTECQPVSKNTEDTAVTVRTIDTPVKTDFGIIPKVVEVRNNIENSTEDTPKKDSETEVDKSKNASSKTNKDTDLMSRTSSNETEKSKIVSSKASSDTDLKSKTLSTDTESEKTKNVSSKAVGDTESENKNTTSSKTESKAETKKDSDKDKDEPKAATKTPPKEYHIDVKHITQHKDMPTGCEIVSARIVLEYYGKNITYKHMLSYMTRDDLKTTKDGKLYGKTPYQAFLGDPTESSGFGCYPPVIMEMIANYNYNDLYAESTCNLPLDFIAKTYLPQDIPVLVWATIGMGDSYLTNSWYIEGEDGKPTNRKYTWRAAEHCLVLIGYDEKYYYFSDPLSYQDVTKYEKSIVEKRYKEVGYNSMIIRKYE